MVRIWSFHCRGLVSVPGRGTEIPQATQCGKRKKRKDSGKTMKSAVILILLYLKDVIDRIKSKIRYCTRKKSVNLNIKQKKLFKRKQRGKKGKE